MSEDRYRWPILSVCQDLHSVVVGSLDHDLEFRDKYEWLDMRRRTWQWGAKRSDFDAAVLSLVDETLYEVKWSTLLKATT